MRKAENSPVYIITLDKIDHIFTLDLEFLYQLFTWSMSATSRHILIGIAKVLDLTDRLLPRLKAQNLKPHLLQHIRSYIGRIVGKLWRTILPIHCHLSRG